MKKVILALAGAAVLVVTVASSGFARSAATADVCVLLPDTKSSVRWETADRPFLDKFLKQAGVSHTIVNAEGSAQTQRAQADQCLTNGAKVLLLTSLDAGSGAAIQNAAKARGVPTIDYDRIVLNGSSTYYITFDNVRVGKLIGQNVANALKAAGKIGKGKGTVVAYLNGGPTDNNSKQLRAGYNSVFAPYFSAGTLKKGPEQSVPDWDNQKALTIFEQMLVRTNNKIDAVAAANDGLANASITARRSKKLTPVPTGGQDATAQGVQNVISGWQTVTVYKPIQLLANQAANMAIAVVKGVKVKTNAQTNNGTRNVPTLLLTPIAITKANYQRLFTDGYLKKKDVCSGIYAKYCK